MKKKVRGSKMDRFVESHCHCASLASDLVRQFFQEQLSVLYHFSISCAVHFLVPFQTESA